MTDKLIAAMSAYAELWKVVDIIDRAETWQNYATESSDVEWMQSRLKNFILEELTV